MELDERTINLYENLKVPSIYWKDKSLEYRYWFRSMLQKIDTAIVFKGLPDGWSEDFFHFCLNAFGFVVVFKSDRADLEQFGEDGVLFQPCTLGGYDFYYNPKWVQVTNPVYRKRLMLGEKGNAELLKLTPDFCGTLDIIDHYATQLAECSKSIMMSLINSKFGLIISASNSAQSAMVKKIFDKIQSGEPLVVYKSENSSDSEVMPVKEPFEAWTQELSKNFILLDQIEALKEILNQFYTEIGLPVAIEKKERLVTSEADFASAQSQARISCWVETLNECLKNINNHFDINIEVEYACKNDADRNGDGIEQPDRPEVDR